jgi:hypothetical protein
MHQTHQDQATRHPGNSTSPIPSLADALELLEPGSLAAIYRHQELSLGAKAPGSAAQVAHSPRNLGGDLRKRRTARAYDVYLGTGIRAGQRPVAWSSGSAAGRLKMATYTMTGVPQLAGFIVHESRP